MIDTVLGNYRVTRKLGEGGMGTVYQAEHVSIGRKAAIKVLLPELSHHTQIVQRFFNEARATSMIEHPGLVSVYDFGYHDSNAYIIMEFISGENLAQRIARERSLAPEFVVALARQIANALGAAHARNIVHRDMKPDNVMLVVDRDVSIGLRAKVLDFGIAKLGIDPSGATHLDGPDMRTHTGAVMGTPAYMSPEQCRGAGEVDVRTDIYALGCIIFAMLVGKPPFDGVGSGEIMAAHMRDPVPRITDPRVPRELIALIDEMLAKHADARPQTMEVVISRLDRIAGRTTGQVPTQSTSAPAIPIHAQPTTLGASTGQIPMSPPAASKGKLLGIGLGVAVVGTAATFLIATKMHGSTPTPDAAIVAKAPPLPDAPPPPDASPDAPPKVEIAARKLHVESTPSGATATLIDGAARRSLGVTPVDVELPDREVKLELAMAGFSPATQVIAATDRLPNISLTLVKDKVRLTIVSTPSGAVVVDATSNQRKGKTPFRVEVDRNSPPHKYRLTCLGYADQTVELSLAKPAAMPKLVRDRTVPLSSECE